VTIYQNICFRLYGISLVKRSKYVVMDRHELAYLNGIEKFNCLYLWLWQWGNFLHPRDYCENRTILVPNQARAQSGWDS
jgi:hypothetical protein